MRHNTKQKIFKIGTFLIICMIINNFIFGEANIFMNATILILHILLGLIAQIGIINESKDSKSKLQLILVSVLLWMIIYLFSGKYLNMLFS